MNRKNVSLRSFLTTSKTDTMETIIALKSVSDYRQVTCEEIEKLNAAEEKLSLLNEVIKICTERGRF